MTFDNATTIDVPSTWFKKPDKFAIPGSLMRAHRIIRTERDKEIQFLKLCSQIKIDNYKQDRSSRQKDNRIAKRLEK